MTSRDVLFLGPCLLLVAAVGAGACGSQAPVHMLGPVITSAESSSSTSTTTTSSSAGPASSSSSGGTGGAGTGGAGTGGAVASSSSSSSSSASSGAIGAPCSASSECATMSCVGGVCVPSCTDDVQDGNETDIDCGGGAFGSSPACPRCADGKKCQMNSDCVDGVCGGPAPTTCLPPTCNDHVQNQGETDVDCGGPCPGCKPGQTCGTSNTNCASILTCSGTCQCPLNMAPASIPPNATYPTGTSYCIDQSEADINDYMAWLNTIPDPGSQDPWCKSWNLSFAPTNDFIPNPPSPGTPIQGVNWCQAQAFCASQGKHLCGQMGGTALPLSAAAINDFTQDEWYNACSLQGTLTYPTGMAPGPALCNIGSSSPAPVSSFANCVGGFTGLVEMSGNVAEWEDSCDGYTSGASGQNDNCAVRGGSYQSGGGSPIACNSGGVAVTHARSYTGPDVGFRCCLL
jgi:hypothetical protein